MSVRVTDILFEKKQKKDLHSTIFFYAHGIKIERMETMARDLISETRHK